MIKLETFLYQIVEEWCTYFDPLRNTWLRLIRTHPVGGVFRLDEAASS